MAFLNGLAGNVGSLLYTLAAFLFVFSVVMVIHEYAHFIVARWCGVKVTVFSWGWGNEVCGVTDRHGTRWRISQYPIGGFVKMVDQEINPEDTTIQPEALARLTPEQRAGLFQLKPLWKRAAIIAAGPISNLLLAAGVFGGLVYVYGVTTLEPRIKGIETGSPAALQGLKVGDYIRAIDGRPVTSFNEVVRIIYPRPNREFTLRVERDGLPVIVKVTTEIHEEPDGFGGTARMGRLGISQAEPRVGGVIPKSAAEGAGLLAGDYIRTINGQPIGAFEDVARIVKSKPNVEFAVGIERDGKPLTFMITAAAADDGAGGKVGRFGIQRGLSANDFKSYKPNVFGAVWLGVVETKNAITMQINFFQDVFKGRQRLDQMGGPIQIAQVSGARAREGMVALLELIARLSASIAFINLLPIPLLDGGRLMFYAIEAVQRKPLSVRTMEWGTTFGVAVIATMMLYTTGMDLTKLIRLLTGAF
jgi:regulator of sigma E protease